MCASGDVLEKVYARGDVLQRVVCIENVLR